ncbi:MAG TPA: hypothetical protein VK589_10125 [Chryseolinea sp.]|nr:hypothetical protein [Chryseolinea sp.]
MVAIAQTDKELSVALEVRQSSHPGLDKDRESGKYAGKTIYHVF